MILAFPLWDLATLVNAVVLFDKVFCCRNRWLTEAMTKQHINTLLGEEVLVELPVEEADIAESMCKIWDYTKEFIRDLHDMAPEADPDERRMYLQAWSRFLGQPAEPYGLFHVNHTDETYASYGSHLTEELLRPVGDDEKSHSTFLCWSQLLSESNLRGEFNIRLAFLMGLPYMPNSLRMPIQRVRYERAKQIAQVFQTLQMLERHYADAVPLYSRPREARMTLPIFLAALIHRIDDLDQFWTELAELRQKAKKFRERRAAYDQACSLNKSDEVDRLGQALLSEAGKAPTWLKITTGSLLGTALASFQPMLGAAPFTVQLAVAALTPVLQEYGPELLTSGFRRLWSPQLWFLSDVGAAARQVLNAQPKIERLWGGWVDERFGVQQLERLSSWGVM